MMSCQIDKSDFISEFENEYEFSSHNFRPGMDLLYLYHNSQCLLGRVFIIRSRVICEIIAMNKYLSVNLETIIHGHEQN